MRVIRSRGWRFEIDDPKDEKSDLMRRSDVRMTHCLLGGPYGMVVSSIPEDLASRRLAEILKFGKNHALLNHLKGWPNHRKMVSFVSYEADVHFEETLKKPALIKHADRIDDWWASVKDGEGPGRKIVLSSSVFGWSEMWFNLAVLDDNKMQLREALKFTRARILHKFDSKFPGKREVDGDLKTTPRFALAPPLGAVMSEDDLEKLRKDITYI